MDLIKQINEDAVGGGAVGAVAMPLFAQFARRANPSAGQQIPKPIIIKYGKAAVPAKKKVQKKTGPLTSLGLKEAFASISEDLNQDVNANVDPDFDSSEVTAKLKSLEQRDKEDYRDTTTFGLEDDDGKVIRVRVKTDQASEFEKALQAFMSDAEEDEELPEIAELLFKLKDQFDIVDVEWPEVEEDEEVDQSLEGDAGAEGAPAGDAELDGGDMGADADLGAPPAGGANPADLLTQVIDMMKADAEARQAEARAREAEAKNREAESAISQAQGRVKHEEELLDMDTYNKSKKEQEKEAKRLAQLAQWKREVGDGDGEADDVGDFGLGDSIRGGEENEEVHTRRPTPMKAQPGRKTLGGRVHPHDVAKFILNRMR